MPFAPRPSDVIPLVEATYPAKKEASARAFAGLSMGGHHALTVALKNSDTFSYIGAFSSATPADDLVAEATLSCLVRAQGIPLARLRSEVRNPDLETQI